MKRRLGHSERFRRPAEASGFPDGDQTPDVNVADLAGQPQNLVAFRLCIGDPGESAVQLLKEASRSACEEEAFYRQGTAAWMPLQQTGAEFFFERMERPGHCRLRDMEMLGGRADAPALSDLIEGAQPGQARQRGLIRRSGRQ